MGKKHKGPKIPKRILGFKLSKGSRKDPRKLIAMLKAPEARSLALSALSVLRGYLDERLVEGTGPSSKSDGKMASKASALAQPH